jgi:hypothetical protein
MSHYCLRCGKWAGQQDSRGYWKCAADIIERPRWWAKVPGEQS